MVGPGGMGAVNNPTVGGGGGGGIVPAYPPSAGVGAMLFNSDFSTMEDASSSAGPQWGIIDGPCDDVTSVASNANIVGGQLVLTLSSTSEGAAVTTCPPTWAAGFTPPSDGGFSFKYGYVECRLVIPTGGWWAFWQEGDNWPTGGECDWAENLSAFGLTTNYWHGTGSGTGVRIGDYSDNPGAGTTVVIGGLWQPGEVTSSLNGVQQADGSDSFISSDDQMLLLNMGYGSGYSSPGDELKVDSVRAWALAA